MVEIPVALFIVDSDSMNLFLEISHAAAKSLALTVLFTKYNPLWAFVNCLMKNRTTEIRKIRVEPTERDVCRGMDATILEIHILFTKLLCHLFLELKTYGEKRARNALAALLSERHPKTVLYCVIRALNSR